MPSTPEPDRDLPDRDPADRDLPERDPVDRDPADRDLADRAPVALHPHEVAARVGGQATFERLVEGFYGRVEQDELRPMYPDDLEPGKHHLALFLTQYWGGGPVYGDRRGHPRLRMRHASFPITPEAALRWAQLMAASIRELELDEDVEQALLTYVANATPTLINQLPADVTELPRQDPPAS
jgi:hemoglobin